MIEKVRRRLRRNGVKGLIAEAIARSELTRRPRRFVLEPTSVNGFERIYHVHIPKCGGTSVNKMFLAAYTDEVDASYEHLAKDWQHYAVIGGMPFVGWNRRLINRGAYFFGFSHTPFHALNLSENTYTFSLVREPTERVISHYRMVLSRVQRGSKHPSLDEEGQWLGKRFADFLTRIPKRHLCNQLYMFSRDFSVGEALENIRRVNNVRPLSQMHRLVEDINQEFNLSLRPIHTRRADLDFEPTPAELGQLKDKVRDELIFYDKICAKI